MEENNQEMGKVINITGEEQIPETEQSIKEEVPDNFRQGEAEQNTEPQKNKVLNFSTTGDALVADLALRLKWFRDQDQEFYTVDRLNDMRFLDLFKDALYVYRNGVVLIERFFLKEKCTPATKEAIVFDEEAEKLYQDFLDFSNSIPNIAELSEQEQIDANAKLKDYQEKLSKISTTTKQVEIMTYPSAADLNQPISLAPLKGTSDETVDKMAVFFSDFALRFLSTMSFRITQDIQLQIAAIENENYIDLVIAI